MRYNKITEFDIANGPGIRTVLWVSGCDHRCRGCHNQITWDETKGEIFTEETMNYILDSISPEYIKGLTLSGGDPLYPSNISTVTNIVKRVREVYPEKSIWLYTGYTYEDIKTLDVLNYIDVLVDGEFILEKKDITLPYCGSKNQRVIDMNKTNKSGEISLYVKGI